MIETNYKQEFIKIALQLESLKNQVRHTFDLIQKKAIKDRIEMLYKRIDTILDEYNEERKLK